MMIIRMMLIATLIHKGDKTHTQLQLMMLQSLSIMKAIVRSPLNPMPLADALADDLLLLIFFLFFKFIIIFASETKNQES